MLYVELSDGSKDINPEPESSVPKRIVFGPYPNVFIDCFGVIRMSSTDVLETHNNAIHYDGIYYSECNVIDPKEFKIIKFSPVKFDPAKALTPEDSDKHQCPRCLFHGTDVKKYNDGRCQRTEVYCANCGYENEY